MTYTVAATRDMRSRFSSLFGEELGSRMEFRTINGVSARIIRAYEQRMGRTAFSLLSSEAEQTALLRVLYFRCKGEYPTDAELKQARTLIAYAKNQMLGKEELDLLWKELDCFPALYRAYQQALRNARQMDYDDQMVYALRILRQVPEILHEFQARYHYFCVDEAQAPRAQSFGRSGDRRCWRAPRRGKHRAKAQADKAPAQSGWTSDSALPKGGFRAKRRYRQSPCPFRSFSPVSLLPSNPIVSQKSQSFLCICL